MRSSRSPTRRIVLVLTIALIVGVAAGGFVYRDTRKSLTSDAFSLLALYHDLRKATLEDYMRSRASDVTAMSRNPEVINALSQMKNAWSQIETDASHVVRRLYIDDNPFPIGQRRSLGSAGDGSEYTRMHQKVHDWAKRFLEHFGYYDLFLIDPDGNILYTVEKEDDFATNLKTGRYAASPLGFVFQTALKGDRVAFSDYQSYAPSNGVPALFAGSVVRAGDGSVAGVFAVQLAAEPINAILRFAEGMGETGETYIVGNDLMMRSQSRFSEEPTVLSTKVDTPSVSKGLGGLEGSHVIPDYRGIPVLSYYSAVDFGGPQWVLLAEIDEAEVLARLSYWPAVMAALFAALAAAFICHLTLGIMRRT